MRHNQFSEAEILAGIIEWAGIESPSTDPAAVTRMMRHAEAALAGLGARTETIPIGDAYGPVMKATLGDASKPGILILGHFDTVHAVGSKEGPLPIRVEGDRLYGPGVLDMKGGMYLAYYAVKTLVESGALPALPVTFLCIPEEELGSPASRALIEVEARRHRYILVPEPARGGMAVTGRHAFVRYQVTTRGRPAHAGADNAAGRSAIRAMAALVETIEQATDMRRVVSFSVGTIAGGTFVNVVPIECRAEVLAVASSEDNLGFVYDFMAGLTSPHAEVTLEVVKGSERPLFKPHPGTMALYERARAVAAEIGFELGHAQRGGGSDGNFTGALGLPTLDGLGVVGDGAHTHGEHLLISSLVPRARLLAGLIAALDA